MAGVYVRYKLKTEGNDPWTFLHPQPILAVLVDACTCSHVATRWHVQRAPFVIGSQLASVPHTRLVPHRVVYMVRAVEDVPLPTCVVSPLLLMSCCPTQCYNVSGAPACDFPIPLALQSDSLFSVEVSEDGQFRLQVTRPPF